MYKRILELRDKNDKIEQQIIPLSKKKKLLYSNIDISTPMSVEEKELTKQIADLWSQINSNIKEIHKITKLAKELKNETL